MIYRDYGPIKLREFIQNYGWDAVFTSPTTQQLPQEYIDPTKKVLETQYMLRRLCTEDTADWVYWLHSIIWRALPEYYRLLTAELDKDVAPTAVRITHEIYTGSGSAGSESSGSSSGSSSQNEQSSDSNSTTRNSFDSEDSNTEQTDSREDSSENNATTRRLQSDTPQSMVSDSDTGLDAEVSWEYASMLEDTGDKLDISSSGSSESTINTNRESTHQSTDTQTGTRTSSTSSTNTNTNSSTSNSQNENQYDRITEETGGVSLALEYWNYVLKTDAFSWLTKQLEHAFFSYYMED